MSHRAAVLAMALLSSCGSPGPDERVDPRDFRISEPTSAEDLAWLAIEPMWEAVDIYGDEATLLSTMSGATPGQRAVFSCWWYRSEVNNGGHNQFFFNSTGILWEETLQGMRLLGANDHVAILEAALSSFPESRPSKERETRIEQLERVDSRILNQADDRFYDLEERASFDEHFLAYIRSHREEFFVE